MGTHSPNVTPRFPTHDGAVLGTATAATALTERCAAQLFGQRRHRVCGEGSALTFTVNRTLANGESVATAKR